MKCLVNNLRKGTCTTCSLSNAAVIPPKYLASTIVCSQELHVVPFLAIGLNWAPDHFFWCPPHHTGRDGSQTDVFHKSRTVKTSLTLLPSHLQLPITFFGLNIHGLLGCLAQVTHCLPYICSSVRLLLSGNNQNCTRDSTEMHLYSQTFFFFFLTSPVIAYMIAAEHLAGISYF